MKQSQIKVSIVVAVYNLEKYLPRCLDSLVNQTLQEIEILCVDDGSTDSAPQIIDKYAKKYPYKVKAFHKENGGEFTSRNYGLERAKGEYITFVDIDDYVELDWAEKLYKAAKENDADLAVCAFERINIDTNKVTSVDMTGFGKSVKKIKKDDDFVAFINSSPWNKIYRMEIIQNLRFYPFRGFNDLMLLMEFIIKANKIAFIPDVLYHYYLRSDSQIHSVNKQDVENLKKYLLKVKESYIKAGKYEDMKEILDIMAFLHLGTSVMYRASYDEKINIKELTRETIKYLNENFPTWRKNRFLTFRYSIKKGFKHIGLWGISLFYKWNMPMVYIRIYRFKR